MTSLTREDLVFMAKMAEQVDRYDEMVDAMKQVAELGLELTVEERQLLSVAYKNVIGTRRAAWRIVSSIERKEESKSINKLKLTGIFKKKIESELIDICDDVTTLLSNVLIPHATSGSSKVLYYKMMGDYYRYLAEFQTEDNGSKTENTDKAENSYKLATDIAASELKPTHPIRLGLALNFSVFYYEIANDHKQACTLARYAFDDALAELESLEEDSYKDSTLILQLLRDNLAYWNTEEEEGESRQE